MIKTISAIYRFPQELGLIIILKYFNSFFQLTFNEAETSSQFESLSSSTNEGTPKEQKLPNEIHHQKFTQNTLCHAQPEVFRPQNMIFVDQLQNTLPFPRNSDPLQTPVEIVEHNLDQSPSELHDVHLLEHQNYSHSSHATDSNQYVVSHEILLNFEGQQQSSDANKTCNSSSDVTQTTQLTDSSVVLGTQHFKPEIDFSNSEGLGFCPQEIKLEQHNPY